MKTKSDNKVPVSIIDEQEEEVDELIKNTHELVQ